MRGGVTKHDVEKVRGGVRIGMRGGVTKLSLIHI